MQIVRNTRLVRSITLVITTAMMVSMALANPAQAEPICEIDPPAPGVFALLSPTCDPDYESNSYFAGTDVYIPPQPDDASQSELDSIECDKAVQLVMTITSNDGVHMKAAGNVKCSGRTLDHLAGEIQIYRDTTKVRYAAWSAGAVLSPAGFTVNAYKETSNWECHHTSTYNYRARLVYTIYTIGGGSHGPYSVRTPFFRGKCE